MRLLTRIRGMASEWRRGEGVRPMVSKTHNFVTHTRDISYSSKDKGMTGTISGIDSGSQDPLAAGDYIILPGKSSGGLSRYKITAIQHRYAPRGAYTGEVAYCDWTDAEWEREYPMVRACLNAGMSTWETP